MNTKVKERLCLIRQLVSFSSSCTVSLVLILFLCAAVQYGTSQVLTPPYFNLAENRPINATNTCGENGIEEYCKLVGASADTDINIDIRRGQVRFSPTVFSIHARLRPQVFELLWDY